MASSEDSERAQEPRQARDAIAALGAAGHSGGQHGSKGTDNGHRERNGKRQSVSRSGSSRSSSSRAVQPIQGDPQPSKEAVQPETLQSPPRVTPPQPGYVAGNGMPVGLKVLLVGALATITFAGLSYIQNIFAPAFFALTLVLTVRPIHRWLLRKGMPVWFSAVVTITTLVGSLLTIVGLMAWSLVGLPDVVRSYGPSFQRMTKQVLDFAAEQGLSADQLTNELLSKLDFGQAVNTLTNVVNSLSSTTALIALMALALLFITIDTMTLDMRARVVENHDSGLFEALSSFEGRVRQYWLVSSIFGLIVAVFNYVVLRYLDVPLPVAWALFSFITNYIPNLGFVIGVIPPALIGLLDSGWVTLVWVVIAYSLINATIQGVFQPKFTGDAVGLSTTVTFLSLVFWTVVVGPLGAILAVPLTLFAKALLIDSSVQTRWMEAFLIPEGEARKKEADGYYDEQSPAPDTFIDLTAQDSEERKKIQRTLRSVALRGRRARTEKK